MCRPLCSTLLFVLAGSAQLRTNHGELAGRVLDQTRQPIPGVTLRITDRDKAISRSSATGADGAFRFLLVPPGTYLVTAGGPGLALGEAKDVVIRTGETTAIDFTLLPQAETIRIQVTAAVPPLDFEKTEQSAVVELEAVSRLPINRRHYLDFVLLTPGAVESTTIADSADFRPSVAPTSGLSFAGSNGRGNAFTIDGIENNGVTGNVRPSIPQVAVREFQVNRNSYPAELGGASGGVINVVSRSGANQTHGSLFGYLRHRSLQARNYFDPAKSAFTRVQSGASLSGPLKRDRTFYFAAFERLDRHESAFVTFLRDPGILERITPPQEALLGFLASAGSPEFGALAALGRRLLTPSANPTVVPLFQANSGAFPFSAGQSQASFRLDHAFRDNNRAFARANYTRESYRNTRFGALNAFNRGNRAAVEGGGLVVEDSHSFSPQWLAVARLAFSYDRTGLSPNDPYGPALDIAGVANFGRDFFFPFIKYERHDVGQLTLSRVSSRHTLKFGADINPIHSSGRAETFFGGRFSFGSSLPLGLVLNAIAGGGAAEAIAAAAFSQGRPDAAQALALPITSLQAFSLGLPEAYIQAFGDPRLGGWLHRYSGFVDDLWRVRPGLAVSLGLRYQTDAILSLPTQRRLAPRLGFAWSPAGASNLVVRGGYGLYFNVIESHIAASATSLRNERLNVALIPITGVPGLLNPATGAPLNSIAIYQSLAAQGVLGRRAIRFEDLAPLGVSPGLRWPVTGGVADSYVNPYTQQASFEIERSFGDLVTGIAWNFSRAAHLPRTRDDNLVQIGTRPDGFPVFGRRDPLLLYNFMLEPTGNAFYHALILKARKRMSNRWSLQGHYVFSKAIDDVTDFPIDYAPHNQLDARADRGLSYFHQAHRVVVSGVFESGNRGGAPLRRALLRDWTLAPIGNYNSFRPFNLLTGTDNLGDGQVNTHRPLGIGRNVGRGPDFFSLDFRLTRAFPLSTESRRVEVTFEAFNLLNRANFQSVNNVVGDIPAALVPRPPVAIRANPATPLAFSSAKDPRQFQLGVTIHF